jgi:hypothetical protein
VKFNHFLYQANCFGSTRVHIISRAENAISYTKKFNHDRARPENSAESRFLTHRSPL